MDTIDYEAKADMLCEKFYELRSLFDRTTPAGVSYPNIDIDVRASMFGYGVWVNPDQAAAKFEAAILVYEKRMRVGF